MWPFFPLTVHWGPPGTDLRVLQPFHSALTAFLYLKVNMEWGGKRKCFQGMWGSEIACTLSESDKKGNELGLCRSQSAERRREGARSLIFFAWVNACRTSHRTECSLCCLWAARGCRASALSGHRHPSLRPAASALAQPALFSDTVFLSVSFLGFAYKKQYFTS